MPGRISQQTDTYRRVKAFAVDNISEPIGKALPRDRSAFFKPSKRVDRRWVENAADEYAVSLGCHFDAKRGEHFSAVCRDHLRLWEGDWAGHPLELLDWQRDCTMRIFGWVRWSDHAKRWVRRFRRAAIWVPKKNGKSPLGAAVGLYLLKWDGEHGGHVYSAARDGKQAQIVHRHAQNMIAVMPEALRSHFSINRTTNTIVYPQTFSDYAVIAADNILSQEGLNGSAIIDEAHVVDDRLARVLTDMGASRTEPLVFIISTAGNDPTTFGFKEYQYGKSIADGEVREEAYFFRSYEAAKTDDDALLKCRKGDGQPTRQLVKLFADANPSWGKTIEPREFVQSYVRSKRAETDWRGFKQRRLNIWQSGLAGWLPDALWRGCGEMFPVNAMYGLGGGLGIDLSRSRDMTAAVFVARDDDLFRLWPMFWIPEAHVQAIEDKTPVLEWVKRKQLTVIPGRTIRLAQVEDDIVKVAERIGTTCICFDPRFSLEFAENLEKRLKLDCVEFNQTHAAYGGTVEEFERHVVDVNIRHPKNDILTWQIGNVNVTERQGCRKPEKQKGAAHKTIDGVVASLMGMKACLLSCGRRKASMFEEHEPVFV